MQFNNRGAGASSYLQGSMVPTMVDASKYWSADPTISTHADVQGLLERTNIKGMGETYAQIASDDAMIYEAEQTGQTRYNQAMGQAQTRFAADVFGGAVNFATGMASLGGGGASNFMNSPNIDYDKIWNGNVVGF